MNKLNITLIFTFLLLTFSSDSIAQFYSTRSKKAIKYYEQAKWTNSPGEKQALLRVAIKKDPKFTEAYMQLARTYAMQDSMELAINILKPICNSERAYYSELLLDIANYQYLNGEYRAAYKSVSQVTDMRYYNEIESLKALYLNAIELKKHPILSEPQAVANVNTIYDDYFPSITADGSMLSTTVLLPCTENYIMQEDIFISKRDENGWTKSYSLSKSINTINNEGAQTFSADGRYMFFVSCDNSGSAGCDIYYSIRQGKSWSSPINLGYPTNSEYWESNPVMSAAGDKIYFTSNRPGGIGDRDIWVVDVRIMNNGYLKCSNAKSLGKPINTEYAEWAPYIHADNETLYFASNGHGGLGRNDIFISRNIRGKWSIPTNMGYPINTHGDESGLTVSGDGQRAYFASDKLGDAKNLDIFEIELPKNLQPKAMSSKIGIVVDATTFQPLQANIEIYDLSTNERFFESLSDKSDGTFTLSLPSKGTFGLSVKKQKYLYYGKNIEENMDTLRILLQKITPNSKFDLHNIFFSTDSDLLLEKSDIEINRLVKFLNENPYVRIKIIGHTDNKGSKEYNKDLSLRRAMSLFNELTTKKKINKQRIEYNGLGDTCPIASNDTEAGRALNRRLEIIIIK